MDNELFELCKEVYKRTVLNGIHEACFDSSCNHHAYYDNGKMIAPKYTSDYLLEKLPKKVDDNWWLNLSPELHIGGMGTLWVADYQNDKKKTSLHVVLGDTPLKALLKLVIALDDAGVKLS